MTVLNALQGGDTLTRGNLVFLCGMSDRQVRDEIRQLRKAGVCICSTSDGKGYHMARSMKEVSECCAELRSRALDMLETADRMRDAYSSDGQLSFRLEGR
jgi:biotin operon repressor